MISPRGKWAIAASVLLAGCVAAPRPIGHDYAQSAVATFVMNETTVAQVEAALGAPFSQSTARGLANGKSPLIPAGTPIDVTTLTYAYAPQGYGRVGSHPSKRAVFVFVSGRLVLYNLANAMPGEIMGPIDEARLGDLHRGQTTRDEAIAIFGMPIQQSFVFLGPQAGSTAIGYGWSHNHGGVVDTRTLNIDFDRNGRMTTYSIVDKSTPLGGVPGVPFVPPLLPPAPAPVPVPQNHPAPDLSHT